jgi:hypothetical protein
MEIVLWNYCNCFPFDLITIYCVDLVGLRIIDEKVINACLVSHDASQLAQIRKCRINTMDALLPHQMQFEILHILYIVYFMDVNLF